MKGLEGKLAEAYGCLSQVSRIAYKDVYLISNQVLSKNPFTNTFVKRVVFGMPVEKVGLQGLVRKLLKYYVKSSLLFMSYLLTFAAYRVFGGRDQNAYFDSAEDLVLVNTFFLVGAITREGRHEERYFPGLEAVIRMRNRRFAYLPTFYGTRSPTKLLSVIRLLRKQRVPMVCEFELLRPVDLYSLLCFVLTYPSHVIRLANQVDDNGAEIFDVLRGELLSTIDQVTFHGYLRYLVGKRAAEMPSGHMKVISWYENQVIDKNLYRGLAEGNKTITIYGAQLYLSLKEELNTVVDESERKVNVVPHRILVNGTAFLPGQRNETYSVGPSLRYRRLFEVKLQRERQEKLLVLLPYYVEVARYVLNMLSEASIDDYEFIIKEHPAHLGFLRNASKPGSTPANWVFSEENIYELFPHTKIAIGTSSGSILEAASVGIPVIVIRQPGSLDCDILPEHGKGVIWEEAWTGEQLRAHIKLLGDRLIEAEPQLAAIAEHYRQQFYCYPSEEKIIDAFDL